MLTAHNQFLHNIKYIRELDSLYHSLKDTQNLPNDLSDLLRAELVYAVSALDKLVHELIKIGMIEAFNGNRPKTKAFERFTISAKTLDKIRETIIERQNITSPPIPDDLPEYWFEQEIVLKHKSNSYQDPQKIADGLSLIWEEPHKWQKISGAISSDEKNTKTQLEIIVARRNQIVHEADIDLQTGLRNIISDIDAKESVDFIEKIGAAIFDCVGLAR
jgi:hypothetical protein